MQSTICALQQQLKEAKQQLVNLKSSTKLTEAPAATTPIAAPSAAVAVAPPETAPLQSNPAPPAVTISAPAVTVVVKQERTSDGRVKMETNAAVKVEPRTYDSKVKSEQIEKLTRQSEAELPPPPSASWATAFSERPGVKSPSTPTEEETFRIPEAPRTPEMGPMSPAIPEDAASDPAPQEEARTTTGIQSSSEQPMEEDSPVTSWASKEAAGGHGEDDNRTFQFSSVAAEQQQQQRVNLRTTEDRRSTPETAVVVGTSANEVRDDRTHRHIKEEKMEASADVDRSEENTADKETPMETEPVPRTAQEGQNQQVDGIAETKTNLEEQPKDPSAAANKSDDHSGAYAERGDRKTVSENDSTAAKNQTALCDSKATSLANNSSATAGVPAPGTPNGDERTMRQDNKEEKTSDKKGTELGSNDNSGAMNHDDTKNGEFSPAHPEHNTAVTSSSTPVTSSETNNASHSNCINQANNPNNNSKEDVESLSKSNEDGSTTAIIAPTDSSQQNSETEKDTTSSPPSSAVLTDINRTTNSPVKQILVKTNNDGESGDGELPVSAAGGEIEGQTNVADVPPLRENGPETVSN